MTRSHAQKSWLYMCDSTMASTTSVCRLCTKPTISKRLISLFSSSGIQHKWNERISGLLEIEVDSDDGHSPYQKIYYNNYYYQFTSNMKQSGPSPWKNTTFGNKHFNVGSFNSWTKWLKMEHKNISKWCTSHAFANESRNIPIETTRKIYQPC